MKPLSEDELDRALSVVFENHDYDFRHYARSSMARRIGRYMDLAGLQNVEQFCRQAQTDSNFVNRFVCGVSVNVTAMFRDPEVYRCIRQQAVPFLKTFPFFNIWVAGCSTGEEVYSLAILLREEGIYDRACIYATDINSKLIARAQRGVYSKSAIQQYEEAYLSAGGTQKLQDYFHQEGGTLRVNDALKRRIVFATHNLVCDGVFGAMQLISCRNVLIYFDDVLKRRVVNLFSASLDNGGVLCLGKRESLDFFDVEDQFVHTCERDKLYRKQDSDKVIQRSHHVY